MQVGGRLGAVKNLVDWAQRRRIALRVPHYAAGRFRLARHRGDQIPIALASKSRFRTIEFLQRLKRRLSYLPIFGEWRRRNLNIVRHSKKQRNQPFPLDLSLVEFAFPIQFQNRILFWVFLYMNIIQCVFLYIE
jgi:hypothetical protein